MSSSSAHHSYSTTSSDSIGTITITGSSYDTITLTDPISLPTYNIGAMGSTFTSGSIGSAGTVTVNGISSMPYVSSITTGAADNWTMHFPEEWVNCFPDFDRIKEMCEVYPGLKIVYEKFVTTYKLVKDDYDNPKIKK